VPNVVTTLKLKPQSMFMSEGRVAPGTLTYVFSMVLTIFFFFFSSANHFSFFKEKIGKGC
jgi:hypothetical protein